MYIGQALFLAELQGHGSGLVKAAALQHHMGTVVLGVVDLDQRRGGGHNDGSLNACPLGRKRNALGMVACGGRNQPLGLLLVGEGGDLIARATHLISACDLHILRLNVNLAPSAFGVVGAVNQVCVGKDSGEQISCLPELGERHHS